MKFAQFCRHCRVCIPLPADLGERFRAIEEFAAAHTDHGETWPETTEMKFALFCQHCRVCIPLPAGLGERFRAIEEFAAAHTDHGEIDVAEILSEFELPAPSGLLN